MSVFESFLTFTRFETAATLRRSESMASAFALPIAGGVGEVYNQETFRHLLSVEQVRAYRSGRPVFLLLVGLRRCPEAGVQIPDGKSAALIASLAECVREVDFVGWYRNGSVLGAVLTQGLDAPAPADARLRIVERVKNVLCTQAPKPLADRLRMRVVRLGSKTRF